LNLFAWWWNDEQCRLFELADISRNVRDGMPVHSISLIALEAVKRIDAIFDIEYEINGKRWGGRSLAASTVQGCGC
jgi:hypothetical protein